VEHIEREILLAVLKETSKANYVRMEDISREARVPRGLIKEIIREFSENGLLKLDSESIVVDCGQRLKIALRAVELGSDIERVARFLTWAEFEDFSRISFEENGFTVKMNFHFTWLKKRWEIDIVGIRKPLIISADCKHWRQKWSGSASLKAAEKQIERTRALAESSKYLMNKIGINGWKYAYFVPVVLSLFPSQYKFHERTPIVPILSLNDFLKNVIVHLKDLNSFFVSYDT